MNDIRLLVTMMTHAIYATLRTHVRADVSPDDNGRDAGAVSLEQVLWFVAAGVSVVVIAAILWGKIRDEANKPVSPPQAP